MINKLKARFLSKVSNKIFLTSLILIVIILLIQVFMYSFVFDDAYKYHQKSTLEDAFEIFTEDLKAKHYDVEYANLLTEDFIEDTGAPIAIVSSEERIINQAFLSMYFDQVKAVKDGKTYNFALENIEAQYLHAPRVNIAYIPISDDWYYPVLITTDPITAQDLIDLDEADAQVLEAATIVDYSQTNYNGQFSGILVFIAYEYIENATYDPSNSKIQTFTNTQAELNMTAQVLIDSYVLQGQRYYIITTQLISQIDNQLAFINTFNFYIFCLAVLIAIGLTRFYSKSISRPMIQLNTVAKGMSNLDFSLKIQVKSHDEIGSLGHSINNLSTQLQISIDGLEAKNYELTQNYLDKIKDEQRAKDLILHLSHELNTPLGIVSGFNEILSDGINDKPPQYYYDAMAQELDRMKTLVNDMLVLSVLEGHKEAIELQALQVDTMVDEIIHHYQGVFDENNITVTGIDTLPPVLGHYKKIYQVLDNLISNASKYTDPHGVFEVTYAACDDKVTLMFSNTCTNLKADEVDHLWEKFYRTKVTKTRQSKGSGIGLSISKEILDLHKSFYTIKLENHRLTLAFSLAKALGTNIGSNA